MSPQEYQASVPCGEAIACEDESYTKNTLGERLDHPECVKVLGVKRKPVDDALICDLSNLYKASFRVETYKTECHPQESMIHLGGYLMVMSGLRG